MWLCLNIWLENPVTSYGLKSETSAQIPCGGGMELMVI